jgi:hypothetical protein
MTDRELLEAAARSAGIELRWHPDGTAYADTRAPGYWGVWNPLTDDGDALRLAVKLNIDLMNCTSEGLRDGQSVIFPINRDFDGLTEWYTDGDKLKATRRAIVRAAAAMAPKEKA